jgi:predicted anti-sigma-YlaC factor YlaD
MILFLWPLLAAGATNVFNFVVTASKPFTRTNLTAKVTFSRVVLEGGKLADVAKQVTFNSAGK